MEIFSQLDKHAAAFVADCPQWTGQVRLPTANDPYAGATKRALAAFIDWLRQRGDVDDRLKHVLKKTALELHFSDPTALQEN
jgi:hypothetical protein